MDEPYGEEGFDKEALSLTAAADSSTGPLFLQMEGKATLDGRETKRKGAQKLVLGRDGSAASSVRTLGQFALAWVLREPNVASAIVGASRPGAARGECRGVRARH